jgi:vancomycin resistance protein YoaR
VLVAGVGLAFAGPSSELPAGIEVAGIDVGGLTSADAHAALVARARRVERVPVTFTAGEMRWRLSPSQAGLRRDWASALEAAERAGDGFGPWRGLRRLRVRLAGLELDPAVSVFPSVVRYSVDELAKGVDRPPVEAAVRRRGLAISVTEARPGVRLDRQAAGSAIIEALASFERGPEVDLPLVVTAPRVTAAELEAAAAEARTALAAPIVLEAGATRLRVPRSEIAQILRLPTGGATRVELAGPGADRWLARLQDAVERAPRDATFRVRPGGIDVVAARSGRALDVAETARRVLAALRSRSERTVALPFVTAPPTRSTDEAKAMGINGVVGSYTTTYGGTPGRLANVQLVTRLIDGALIAPGATFSFNETTGERTAEQGFQEAPVIINGELQNGIGGGVCQVSTTVFNAAFEAGLPIDSRTNHALYISHYPLGRDATVNYPDIDLRFTNDTGRWLLLRAFANAGSLTVNLYGTPQERRVETEAAPLAVIGKIPIERTVDPTLVKGMRVVDQVGTPPRETRVVRRVYNADGSLRSESSWASSYRGEPTLVRVGTRPKPTPKAPPTAPPGVAGPSAPVGAETISPGPAASARP